MEKPDFDNLQQILDYILEMDDPQERRKSQSILQSDPQAKELAESLRRTLKPLDDWQEESVPVGLADRTMNLIGQHDQAQQMAQASAAIADRRKLDRRSTTTHSRLRWVMGNLRDLLAVAACLMFVVLATRPGIRQARQLSQRHACAANMQQVGAALDQYANDHDGLLPHVKYQPGSVWWGVGKNDQSNPSNTRNVFLLVKNGYLPADVFICPSSSKKPRIRIKVDSETLKAMQDFAGREHVNYSFRLMFHGQRQPTDNSSQSVVMTDQNPIFADFDCDNQTELDLSSEPSLLQVNSPNHNGMGQNALYDDGSVRFSTSRYLGTVLDDIFTIRNTARYRGNEQPEPDDTFIAP